MSKGFQIKKWVCRSNVQIKGIGEKATEKKLKDVYGFYLSGKWKRGYDRAIRKNWVENV